MQMPACVHRLSLSLVLIGGGMTICPAEGAFVWQDAAAVGAAAKKAPKPLAPGDSTSDDPSTPNIIEGAINVYDYSPEADASAPTPVSTILRELGPDAIEWFQHVETLSNPFFEGRAPGTKGAEYAADYIEFWLRHFDLEPAFPEALAAPAAPTQAEADTARSQAGPDAVAPASGIAPQSSWVSYRQPFDLPGAGPKVVSSTVTLSGAELKRGDDYSVLGNSGSGVVEAPVTFVGYGIEEGKDGYTSYSPDSDVKGRVALLLRYEPLDADGKSRWAERRFSEFAAMAGKFDALLARGAAGVILVTPPECRDGRKRLESTATSRFGDRMGVPCIQVTEAQADALCKSADPRGRSLLDLRRLADSGMEKTVNFRDDQPVSIAAEVTRGVIETRNLGGVLRGKGELAKEWVIIGGHYDHVGYGDYGADPSNRGKLHPGADDNASGTAAVLVLIRRLSELYNSNAAPANARSILFLTFSAEEIGLDGSRWWVQHPTLGVDEINAMINLDMVGRLRDDDLAVGGVGTAEGFMDLLKPVFDSSGLTIRADPSGRGPSDHQSFYSGGIPVLFLFTGVHGDYHKPSDEGFTVDPGGAAKVIALTDELARMLAQTPSRLKFTTTDGTRTAGRRGAGVRLGISPGYGESSEPGVHVEAVSAETAAAEAGIVAGDVVLAWNGTALEGPADLMQHLREHKPGDVVKLTVKHDGQVREVDVTLRSNRDAG